MVGNVVNFDPCRIFLMPLWPLRRLHLRRLNRMQECRKRLSFSVECNSSDWHCAATRVQMAGHRKIGGRASKTR